jgi:glyoxylase-like metal-dependent hydrolase (beta-lactamase superfamily II)
MYRQGLDGMTASTFGNPEYEGVNSAHIIDRGGVLVVYVGITEPGVRTEYVEALAERGHDLAEAESVLVTHFHYDHVGLAAEIQETRGAMV